jgi:Lhr-like helicase
MVPSPDEILVETFPRGKRHYLVCYPFEGRLAHQSLGMLIERRHPGQKETRRQITVSSDLIYDALRQNEPDHILLRAAFADANGTH